MMKYVEVYFVLNGVVTIFYFILISFNLAMAIENKSKQEVKTGLLLVFPGIPLSLLFGLPILLVIATVMFIISLKKILKILRSE